jgi:hypothetical protein
MKQKDSYWRLRILLLRQSLAQRRFVEWLRFGLIDFLFLFIVALLLSLFLGAGVKYFGSLQELAMKAVPLVTQQISQPQNSAAISQMRTELVSVVKGILLISFVYFVLFSLVVSSWSFVALSRQLGVRLRLLGGLVFVGLKVVWSFLCAAIIIRILHLLSNVMGIIVSLVALLLLIYLSIIIDFVYFFKERFGMFKTAFKLAFKRIHCLGFAFVVCVFVLLSVDLAFILLRPSFTLLPAVVSLLFLLFFISWSRFYLSLEFREAIKHEN